MASLSPSEAAAAAAAASSVPAAAPAGVLTAAGSSVMASIPRFFAKMVSLGNFGATQPLSAAADPSSTISSTTSSTVPAFTSAFTTNATSATAAATAAAATGNFTAAAASTASAFDGGLRSMGSVFTYATSKWALMCLFMTILLNRTIIYAALRRPIRLPFKARLALRIVPIVLLLAQTHHMLLAMRCQTSSLFRGGDPPSDGDGADRFFHAVGSATSFWRDDRAVCESIGMIPDAEWIAAASALNGTSGTEGEEEGVPRPKGSLDMLWPLYQTLSISQFVEVFTCALVGRLPIAETGMTLLEHSLAFAEAEALATRKTYRLETTPSDSDTEDEQDATSSDPPQQPKKRDLIVFKIKGEKLVPAEVLYIATISALSHVTSHTMGTFNAQSRFRLLTTGFYGLAFLAGFAIALVSTGAAGILDFPTVSVVGFIPHLLILAGITVCAGIYALALTLSSLFPPSGGRSSLAEGYQNLRANLSFASASISLAEDFYTVLLRTGYMCLTAAAEATYLNEGRAVRVPAWTWLEADRVKMVAAGSTGGGRQFLPTGKGAGPFAMERKDFSGVVGGKGGAASARWAGAGELWRGVGAVLGQWGWRGAERSDQMELDEDEEDADYVPSDDDDEGSSSSDDGEGGEDGDGGEGAESAGEREETPLLDPARLAELLDPQSPEDRTAARLLARHLVSQRPLTRGQYSAGQMSAAAEEAALEGILIARRRREVEAASEGGGVGDGGPVCVVCQCEPRTVMVWPCRCLCLCEDCRVCLAMNNWSSCVTCRGKCVGYSRVYVP